MDKSAELAQLDEERDNFGRVTTEGTVVDIVPDDVDRDFTYLILHDKGTFMPVAVRTNLLPSDKSGLNDARVRITGLFHRRIDGERIYSGPYIMLSDLSDLKVIAEPPADPFDAPEMTMTVRLTPREVAQIGKCRAVGTVLAVWGADKLMVRIAQNRIVCATLRDGHTLPPCGASVVIAGYPTTDFYHLNLTRAICKVKPSAPTPDEPAIDIAGEPSRLNPANQDINVKLHGQLIKVTGVVRNLQMTGARGCRMFLVCGEETLTIDLSAHTADFGPLPPVGSRIEVTGRCRLDIADYGQGNVFPRISGAALIPRTRADLRVLSKPSWWTPARLTTAVFVLLAVFAVIVVWNVLLHRLVDRRSRELVKEQLAHTIADLRITDRTNLAIELHDSLSQNLTGISMRLDTAAKTLRKDLEKSAQNIDIAAKAVRSCHRQLRNCIWDLRNESLENQDLEAAIRTAVKMHVGDAELSVRFSGRRDILSDNITHALMRIIRELAVNAVSHGHATVIRIAGAFEDGRIHFSVTDNGCGFDPHTRPGIAEGHFGLDGIAERIRAFDGRLTVESAPGNGTRIAVSISLADHPAQEELYHHG